MQLLDVPNSASVRYVVGVCLTCLLLALVTYSLIHTVPFPVDTKANEIIPRQDESSLRWLLVTSGEVDLSADREIMYIDDSDDEKIEKRDVESNQHQLGKEEKTSLQPWASEDKSLNAEIHRFLRYIQTEQNSAAENALYLSDNQGAACVVYIFCWSDFVNVSNLWKHCSNGVELHVFDPRTRHLTLPEDELPNVSIAFHKKTLDWTTHAPLIGHVAGTWRGETLKGIMGEFGHQQIEVAVADLKGAEWKILQNLLEDRLLFKIRQLILRICLHWRGFEIIGSDVDVVRLWYSILKDVENVGYVITGSVQEEGALRSVLGINDFDTSSCYILHLERT
ncbi:putative methyltransferase-like protein 24 [Saccoglossus kowalevskii]|uniref:Methyltransferase-like protein 24-like n=1 Tax=Saccoglossus kowalevskii TaxID=10224 RepID=A0ABM0GXD9_SACKO|nr:PREDICTED: methyltransferase-like protein 24-like [Saccoglossus kowalevskii]